MEPGPANLDFAAEFDYESADMAPDIRSSVEAFGRSLPDGSRVLDVGCGTRPYEPFFSRCDYVGVDVQESGRASENKQANIYFNGRDLPFADGHFDGVLCTEVLEHAVDPVHLCREMRRVLRPGGQVLITVPFMWGEHEAPYDFRRFSTFGMRRLLDEAGLQIVTSGKLTPGIDAINALVQSEINNFNVNVQPQSSPGLLRRIGVELARKAWAAQLLLWRRLYRFERIYIDNVILATRND